MSAATANDHYLDVAIRELPNRNGKPVFEIKVKSVINFTSGFGHKLLCDGLTFSLGSACAATCAFCYVKAMLLKNPQVRQLMEKLKADGYSFEEVVVVRFDALKILREQLTVRRPRNIRLDEKKVIFTSPLVDPALGVHELLATAEACRIIFELTNWDVRILTKGAFLQALVRQIPSRFHDRLILGHSTGTLDEDVAAALEQGTARVYRRLEDHRWLQNHGFRTFAMLCPSLPQEDPDAFARNALEAVRPDRCEHVWAEVFNLRGDSLTRSCDALRKAGFTADAARLHAVCGPGSRPAWEEYARQTFLAYARLLPPGKLRFLQYVTQSTREWWEAQRPHGAVLLGCSVEAA